MKRLNYTSAIVALSVILMPQAGFAEDSADSASVRSVEIRERISALHARQAEYLEKAASGSIQPDADLIKKWPQIQADVVSIHNLISELNELDADDPQRPGIESRLLGALQEVGLYLVPAEHPPFEPRTLDESQAAEMARIENAIANIDYVDRDKAEPVEILGSFPIYTLVNLPVPLVMKTRPGETIYLYAETSGMFSNGMPAIELVADDQGVAQTTWLTIGESVGTSHLSVYSRIGGERRDIRIEVVSPSLAAIEGVAVTDDVKQPAPPVIHSRSVLRSK